MSPDKVEVTWDAPKGSWLVRIELGEEVVRRHVTLGKNAADDDLRAAANKAVADEGYDANPAAVVINR